MAYDVFAARAITTKPPPWSDEALEQWADYHDVRACEWFQEQGIPVAVGMVGRGIQVVARENPMHPVCGYLNALNWDRTPRLDTWLTRYLGVEDSPYVRAVGSRFPISAVARVFVPGCQADHMLILEGPQGILKSSALRALAGAPWFTDRISNLGSKDSSMEVAGKWFIEMSEFDALTRATNSAIKSFTTRRNERFRPPYGKHVVERPRQCVFVGSINPIGGYLGDPTGARRVWPVACGAIDLEALVRDRDQLWAEVVVRFQAGDRWWLETLSFKSWRLSSKPLDSRSMPGPKRSATGAGRDDVSVGEVLVGALGDPQESWSQTAQNRVAAILAFTGFKRYRPGRTGQPRTPRYRRDAVDHQGDLPEDQVKQKDRLAHPDGYDG